MLELINKGNLNFEGSNAPFRGLELTDNGEIFATKGDYSVDIHFPEKLSQRNPNRDFWVVFGFL